MEKQVMTFGVVPEFEVFEVAFDATCENRFSFTNDKRVGNDDLSCTQLYREVVKATEESENGDEEAGSWASSVMGHLGFEWV